MKSMMRILVTMVSVVACSNSLLAQWVKTNGPCGSSGSITSIAIDSSRIIAGANSGLYLSSDRGNSWSCMYRDTATAFTPGCVAAIVSEGTILAAPPWTGGILRSTDGGSTWIRTDAGAVGVNMYRIFNAIAVVDSVVLAESPFHGGGLYTSTDGGVSWTKLSQILEFI